VNACAIMYESDTDFGQLSTIPSTLSQPKSILLPSQKIDPESISHLTPKQQTELLKVLDRYPECFSDIPGHVDVIEYTISLTDNFKRKQLSAYRVPERLKPEVDRQIQEMLEIGIIRPSQSPMASPLVCVLKGRDGCDGVRLAVDYRYVNRFIRGDVFLLTEIGCVFQYRDCNHFIHVTDCKTRRWHQVFRVIVRSMLISLTQMSSVIQMTVYFDHMSLLPTTTRMSRHS